MKIYLISSGESLEGGVGTYIRETSKLFPDSITVNGCSKSADIFIDGIWRIPTIRSIFIFFNFILTVKPNSIFICHSTAGLLLGMLSRIFFFKNIRVVNVYHGLASRYFGNKLMYLFELITCFLSSQSVFLNKLDMSIAIRGNGVLIPNFAERKYKNESNPCGDIVSVTRWSMQKDNKSLIEACNNGLVNLCIYTKLAEMQLFKNAFPESVSIQHTNSILDIYQGKSIFVLSTFSEGFPLSLMEAASFGLPVVCSDIPVLRSIFGDSCLYFKDPNHLVEIINRLKAEPNFYKKRSNHSKEIVSKFPHENWQSSWINLIQE